MSDRDSQWCDSCGTHHANPAGVGETCDVTMDHLEREFEEEEDEHERQAVEDFDTGMTNLADYITD
jgi:hypothetical protein